eukprot:TRINITY_DN4119_c0_g1_i2.p1 TRINITY_DN4119_c0_g1~~TRINITY_DN4119_c0_g1_i2.p1  ORF type:complete len:417 (-),score=89.01 TRINITY_DN4119_c0_g1_i2:67-1185(-)
MCIRDRYQRRVRGHRRSTARQHVSGASMSASSSDDGCCLEAGGFFDLMDEVSLEEFPGPYPLPFSRDFSLWSRCLTSEACATLDNQGYVVVDGALGEGYAHALQTELAWLVQCGLIAPNKTQFMTADGPKQFSKPSIYEVDLHNDEIRNRVPEFNALWKSEELSRALAAQLPGLQLAHGTNAHTVKLQYNSGSGGCFPLHFDNPGRPNNRAITCLFYLNPNWKPGDGGELLLQPFLGPAETIAPLMDRMVLFKSDRCLHRVMPANAERYCCTVWMDSVAANQDVDINLLGRHLEMPTEEAVEFFKGSALQRVVSRAVYSEEYEESLWECMQGVEGCSEMLKSHEDSMAQVAANAPLNGLVQRFREWKQQNLS